MATSAPTIYTVIRKTWLNRRLDPAALTASLLLIGLFVIASQFYWRADSVVGSWLAASPTLVFKNHEYWRAWTTLFVHGDLGHLVGNSGLFFIFGLFVAGYFGLFVFPLLAIVMGGLINLIVLAQMPPEIYLVGASGVVYWLGGFWLVLYFFLDRRHSIPQRILRAIGVGIALFMPTEAFEPSTSYYSHFLGFLFGVGSGFAYYGVQRRTLLAAEEREVIVEDEA